MTDELTKKLTTPADVLDAFCNLLSGLKVPTSSLINLAPPQYWHIGRKFVERIAELEAQLADAQEDAEPIDWNARQSSDDFYRGLL